MKEAIGDMWEDGADVYVVTTNLTVKTNGENIMGGGCAREAAERLPYLPKTYGSLITGNKDRPSVEFVKYNKGWICLFPVKWDIAERADINLILFSLGQFVKEIDEYDRVHMPRPGCGLGGLDWEEVKPVIEKFLDDRFTVYHYA